MIWMSIISQFAITIFGLADLIREITFNLLSSLMLKRPSFMFKLIRKETFIKDVAILVS